MSDKDTIVVNTDPNGEGQTEDPKAVDEYLEKMAKKADEGTATATNSQEELLAGKYKTREDLLKGIQELSLKDKSDEDLINMYKELEAGVGSQHRSDDDDANSSDDDDPGDGNADDDDNEDAEGSGDQDKAGDSDSDGDDASGDSEAGDEETKGLSQEKIDRFNQEVFDNGTLSDESFTELENLGITREMVNAMVSGMTHQRDQLMQVAGGKEQFEAMTEWGEDNLSDAEIDGFNTALASGDMEQMTAQIEYLKFKYGQQNSMPPQNKITPKAKSTPKPKGYADKAAMQRDISDPRYKSDPGFRKTVMENIAKTSWL